MTNIFSIIIAGALLLIGTTTLMNNNPTDTHQVSNTEINTTTQGVTAEGNQIQSQPLQETATVPSTQNTTAVLPPASFTNAPELPATNEPEEKKPELTGSSRKYTSEDEWKMTEQTQDALTALNNILN